MATTTKKRTVIVVGAGMAGLSAAAELSRSGLCDVIVLEAMPRAGGRIQSVKGFASHVIELGANWLHGTKGNPVYELAEKHNLLHPKESSASSSGDDDQKANWIANEAAADNQYHMENGDTICTKIAADTKRIYAKIVGVLERSDPRDLDARQSMGSYVCARFAKELHERGVEDVAELRQYGLMLEHCCRMESLDIGCHDLHDVQLKSYSFYEVLEGFYYTLLGDAGYQGVINKLLEDIPAVNVHYDTPVAQIQYSVDGEGGYGDSVRIKCEDGRTFSGSHVIVTASVGFLKENLETLFEPALPGEVADALQTFPHGTVNKIFLKFNKPFWTSLDFGVQTLWDSPREDEEDEDEEKRRFYRMLPGFDADEKNSDVLIGWTYGKGAEYMETLGDDEIGQKCVAILRQFLKDPSIPYPDKILCTRWHGNKYQRGAYGAYLPKGASGKEFEIMNTPIYQSKPESDEKVPVLCFAGEAFSNNYHSTTHGAMQSGRDRAKALIEFMSN